MEHSFDKYYYRTSAPFVHAGEEQYVEVIDRVQTVRRCRWSSKDVIEEVTVAEGRAGCHIYAFNVSPSGAWITTERVSGQGEWGYDVFRTAPFARVGGVEECRGYISEAPRFAADESRIAVFASKWLAWVDDKEPSPGRYVNVGWLYFLRLPGLEQETDHEVVVHLPKGWKPEIDQHRWHMPKEVTPLGDGLRLVPSGGASDSKGNTPPYRVGDGVLPVEIPGPLPAVIVLPTPHPSGKGFL